MLLFLFVVATACAEDFGLIGLSHPSSFDLLRYLGRNKHRIACFEYDEGIAGRIMKEGGIAAFSEAHVVKFAKRIVHVLLDESSLVHLLDTLQSSGDLGAAGKVFMVWGEGHHESIKEHAQALLSSLGATVVFPGELKNVELDNLVPEEDRVDQASKDGCPSQGKGHSLFTRTLGFNCKRNIVVCRLYVRLLKDTDRLHAVALYNVDDDLKTDDPNGFFHAFNSTYVPQPLILQESEENGECDTYLTIGADVSPSCAQADPSFNVTAFLSKGVISKSSGWFCNDPFSPNSVPKTAKNPPNVDGGILVAQFSVHDGYKVSGQVMIIASDEAKKQTSSLQRFECFCDADSE